jgi:hypothetical protein
MINMCRNKTRLRQPNVLLIQWSLKLVASCDSQLCRSEYSLEFAILTFSLLDPLPSRLFSIRSCVTKWPLKPFHMVLQSPSLSHCSFSTTRSAAFFAKNSANFYTYSLVSPVETPAIAITRLSTVTTFPSTLIRPHRIFYNFNSKCRISSPCQASWTLRFSRSIPLWNATFSTSVYYRTN